jgi:hypothetical protein
MAILLKLGNSCMINWFFQISSTRLQDIQTIGTSRAVGPNGSLSRENSKQPIFKTKSGK